MIDGGEGGGAEPEVKKVRDEPAVGDGLDHARSRLPEDEQLSQEVGQREGERSGDHEPLRGEGVTRRATREGDDRPEASEQEGDGKHRADFAREFQERKTRLITGEDLDYAVSESEIPKHATKGREPAVTEFKTTELRKQPEIKSKEGVKAPAIDEQVVLSGGDVPVGQDFTVTERAASERSLLQGGDHAEDRSRQQPDHRGDEEEKERTTELDLGPRDTRVAFGGTALRAAGTIFLSHR